MVLMIFSQILLVRLSPSLPLSLLLSNLVSLPNNVLALRLSLSFPPHSLSFPSPRLALPRL